MAFRSEALAARAGSFHRRRVGKELGKAAKEIVEERSEAGVAVERDRARQHGFQIGSACRARRQLPSSEGRERTREGREGNRGREERGRGSGRKGSCPSTWLSRQEDQARRVAARRSSLEVSPRRFHGEACAAKYRRQLFGRVGPHALAEDR